MVNESNAIGILSQGVAVALLIAIALFIDRRVWPFFTQTWWPASQQRMRADDDRMERLVQAVNSLKVSIDAMQVHNSLVAAQLALILDRVGASDDTLPMPPPQKHENVQTSPPSGTSQTSV